MFKAYNIIQRDIGGHAVGQVEEIISETDKPFDWFPELEKLFENFKIKKLEIEVENNEEGIQRKFFRIIKKAENKDLFTLSPNSISKVIETPYLTVAKLTDRTKVVWSNGNPVYFDGINYWEVDENGFINEVDIEV